MSNRNGKTSMRTTVTTVSNATASIHRKNQIMRITLAVTVLAFFTFLISLTSSDWVVMTYPANFFAVKQNMFIAQSTHGIIWECVLGRRAKTDMYGKWKWTI